MGPKILVRVHLECMQNYGKPFQNLVRQSIGEFCSVLLSSPHNCGTFQLVSYEEIFQKVFDKTGNRILTNTQPTFTCSKSTTETVYACRYVSFSVCACV